MEEAVAGLGFTAVDIMQPSLLLWPRKEARPLEIIGRVLAPLINPLLTGAREQYRAISADTVAHGMVGAARRGGRGIYRYTYGAINQLALIKSNQPNLVPAAKKKPA
jgi:hypothetical protein